MISPKTKSLLEYINGILVYDKKCPIAGFCSEDEKEYVKHWQRWSKQMK